MWQTNCRFFNNWGTFLFCSYGGLIILNALKLYYANIVKVKSRHGMGNDFAGYPAGNRRAPICCDAYVLLAITKLLLKIMIYLVMFEDTTNANNSSDRSTRCGSTNSPTSELGHWLGRSRMIQIPTHGVLLKMHSILYTPTCSIYSERLFSEAEKKSTWIQICRKTGVFA